MENLVTIREGKPMTTSLLVADKFGKSHKDVTRAIRELLGSAQKCANLFFESEYADSCSRMQPMYVMTRDGFSLLVMSFTGKEALDFKFEFIEAFNRMEDTLMNGIGIRVCAVEENIKRRYLLTKEIQDINAQITVLMKRHKAIKSKLSAIDVEDFRQLSLFPTYGGSPVKAGFPNRKNGEALKN
jgi:Rha family phage regulatory protein